MNYLQNAQPNAHLLVVEDDQSITELFQDYFADTLGYQLTVLHDAEKALEQYKNSPQQFDVLITDHSLPNMTGLELCRAIKAIDSNLPMIFLSGVSSHQIEQELESLSITKYFKKPIYLKQLESTIEALLVQNHNDKNP